MMGRLLLIAILFLLSCSATPAQIYRVIEMNTEQIRALDKPKTVVILTGGILEQHGPYLPTYSDGYMNEWRTQELAEAIVTRPGWAVLIFPTIPLGTSGANDIGGKHIFPGSYTVRPNTERAVFMDLASELGEQGFRWIFVMHGHGAPHHNLMLDQAGDYFRDVYKGKMVNLVGLLPNRTQPEPILTAEARKENGLFDVHAGISETSSLLFLRRDLVPLTYLGAKPFTANNMSEAVQHAQADNWLGYIGSPRLANASYGARIMHYEANQLNALAIAILDGLDERTITRLSDVAYKDKAIANVIAASEKHYAEIGRQQLEWMKKKGIE